jgi:transcriptional regulator GlxA family with amidase domain
MNACPNRSSSISLLPRGVRRALEAMRANVGRGWNVPDLASVAGVSGRTLQRQFRIFLGKAPRAALREIRFERARRELLRGLPDAKVMNVALRCGFAHCGRFSVEYRRRYGETPSQTLKRQAVLANAPASKSLILVASRDQPAIALSPVDVIP